MNWDSEEEATIKCYHCGAEIWAEAEQCNACGNYLLDEENPDNQQPKWITLTAIVLILVFLLFAILPLLSTLLLESSEN